METFGRCECGVGRSAHNGWGTGLRRCSAERRAAHNGRPTTGLDRGWYEKRKSGRPLVQARREPAISADAS
jgi:hypothetical protein